MARPTKERVTRNILITALHCTIWNRNSQRRNPGHLAALRVGRHPLSAASWLYRHDQFASLTS